MEAYVLLLMRLSAARSPAIHTHPDEIAQLETLLREAAAALANVCAFLYIYHPGVLMIVYVRTYVSIEGEMNIQMCMIKCD